MEKYLFLDLDGVLNTTEYQAYLFKNQLDRSDEYGELFDPQAVAQL
jgi:histidinol phosphatase-like enzyme